MLREIRIYGKLAKLLKRRSFMAEVASAAEAVRFLLANFPDLEGHMADQHYRVQVGEYELGVDELHDPSGQQVIRIIPVVGGAGGGVGKIIAGVALVAISFLLPGAQLGLFGLGQIGLTAFAAPIMGIGASLALGGVAQLLTPTPKLDGGAAAASSYGASTRDTELDPQKSYSFSGIQNTSRQGVPVPIIFGETIVGSVVISAGIDTVAVAA